MQEILDKNSKEVTAVMAGEAFGVIEYDLLQYTPRDEWPDVFAKLRLQFPRLEDVIDYLASKHAVK